MSGFDFEEFAREANERWGKYELDDPKLNDVQRTLVRNAKSHEHGKVMMEAVGIIAELQVRLHTQRQVLDEALEIIRVLTGRKDTITNG